MFWGIMKTQVHTSAIDTSADAQSVMTISIPHLQECKKERMPLTWVHQHESAIGILMSSPS